MKCTFRFFVMFVRLFALFGFTFASTQQVNTLVEKQSVNVVEKACPEKIV